MKTKTIKVTLIMSNATFLWIWSVASKEANRTEGGLGFNRFLIDYYENELLEKFPDADRIIPRIYGVTHTVSKLLVGGYGSQEMRRDIFWKELKEKFIVEKDKIVNPIEVGI